MNSRVTKKFIGHRIRAARENIGLSQAELGREFGWSQSNISDIERGVTGIEAVDLCHMAEILGKPLSYLVGTETEADRIHAELQRAVKELDETRERLSEVVSYAGDWVWLPLIGQVPAGYPEWQDEDETDIFYPCAAEQIRDGKGAYALRVKGNSMLKCGISDGDIIFVDSKSQAMPGDVIVARKGDEVVLRIYKEDSKGPYLQAGNEGYPILRLKEAEILGVVMGSYRRKPRLGPE